MSSSGNRWSSLRRTWSRARRRPPRATVAGLAALATVASLVPVVRDSAPVTPLFNSPPAVSPGKPVKDVRALPFHVTKPKKQTSRSEAVTATSWPTATRATVHLTGSSAVRAGSSPISVQAQADTRHAYAGPSSVDVRVSGHTDASKVGVNGVLFSLTVPKAAVSGKGSVRISVDYGAFAQAYGGNFGPRLHVEQLPACALTTPTKAACRKATVLASVNSATRHQVAATITLPAHPAGAHAVAPMALAVTADADSGGGQAGNYGATTLKPSGSWSQGGSTGSFDYSYPVSVPPATSGLAPTVAFNYDSGSVDGQTASTQAQSSWVGDGWSTPQSYVEQSFASCADSPEGADSPVSTPDSCYDGPVLTVSLNGATASLIWDQAKQVYKVQNDAGDVVRHVTNSGNGTGTYNTDYWTITDRSGTTYQFGRNELPGWSSGKPTTNSVNTEPVYSAHNPNDGTGKYTDPCYSSAGFASSVCTMAYRWNLDYVTDVHGDAMSYSYDQDANYYGEDNGASNVSYVRDSHLHYIYYGFLDGHAYDTAPNRVVFNTDVRCVSGTCSPLNATNAPNWQDVPFDLVCASGATCSSHSPAFFSTVRLTEVDAQQYSTTTGAYQNVDAYALSQSFPATGDGTSPTLWLTSISHTGSKLNPDGTTSSLTLPPVTFTGIRLQNRVDKVTDNLPAFYRWRLEDITTETGSVITASYITPDPCTAPVTLTPATNTRSCYPVSWAPEGYTAPFLDWFNKWALAEVIQKDPSGGAPIVHTNYSYPDGAAWHYDDNELVKAKYRTYGQFRGWGLVQTRTGDGVNNPKTLSETTYYRGMSDDNNSTAVTLVDSQGGHHDDNNALAGQPLETTAYLGDGGPVDHSTITSYWVSAPTATRARTGLQALTATRSEVAETWTRQALTDGGTTSWRDTETDTSYDATTTDPNFGLATHVYTHTVPADPTYDQCTSTSYAPANTSNNLVGLVGETEVDTVACAGFTEGSPSSAPTAVNALGAPASINRPDQVVSDTRTSYDDPTFATTFPQTAAPSHGDATMVRKATTWSAGAFTYQTVTRMVYDSYGRATTVYDANGNPTTTSYTMNSLGLPTGSTVTNALNQTSSTTVDTQRGLTLTATDPNGVVTTEQYDALGRATAVWLHSRPTTGLADQTYTYQISNTAPVAVTTKALNEQGGYQTSITLYDGLERPRQTQTITPQSGRLITDTLYDSRGLVKARYGGWWDPNNLPSATAVVAPGDLKASVPQQDFYTYDGLGRVVADQSMNAGQLVSTTITVYNGDRTTTIPPTGGITQATVTDPLGRTSELDQYTTAPTLNTPSDPNTGIYSLTGGTINATHYGYDGHGQQSTIAASDGSTWISTFNLLGKAVTSSDPDAGTTSIGYDSAGNVAQTTDARGKTLSYTYDALNRKTGEYDGPVSAQSTTDQLASWVYDNANNVSGMTDPIGQLTTATAYWAGGAYVDQQKGFNALGESLGETVTVPSGPLAGSYAFGHSYTPVNGLPLTDTYPQAGGLPKETVSHGYTGGINLPNTLTTGTNGLLQAVTYDANQRPTLVTIGAGSNEASLTDTYDDHTNHLTDQTVTRKVASPGTVDDEAYTYDLAGNLTSQTSTRLGESSLSETQCYVYDTLDHLSTAWTATDSCAATPTATNHSTVGDGLGTTAAYWTTWGLDPLGNRTTQTQHSTTGGADTTTTYTYNGNTTGQAHTLTSTATTGATTDQTGYAYDPAGNMTARTTPDQGAQTLTWSDADQLNAISGSENGASAYAYDADGNLVLQQDPGSTVLYLPGEQLTYTTATAGITGTRYYPLADGATAVRTGSGNAYSFEITDQHGTPTLYLDYTAQQPTWRQYTPYGDDRSATASASVDNRGFLDQPQDNTTGLTHIGARYYDPTTGRFISDDPVLETTSPQQLNGYSYAASNPTTFSDPTGKMLACGGLGGSDPSDGCMDGSTKPTFGNAGPINTGEGNASSQCQSDNDCAPQIPTCDLKCRLNQQAPWGNGRAPMTWLKQFGHYRGSDKFTYADALEWAQTSKKAAYLVCVWVLGGSNASCGGEPKMSNALLVVNIVEQLLAILAPGAAGDDEDPLVDGWIPETALPAEGSAALDEDLDLAACMLRGESFDASTLVLMASGATKPISAVRVGDKVLATDPATGVTSPHIVTSLHLNQDTQLTDLTVVDSHHHSTVIHTTQHHPFYDDTLGAWVDASELRPGDELHPLAGELATVTSISSFVSLRPMYNLTIEGDHTYYVVAGDVSALVHNDDTLTQNQARLEAMRKAGLPTSLQPISQKYYSPGYGERGGYQYVYEYNGQRWLVTDDWNDLHADVPHDPHWEVGVAKPGGQRDSLGRERVGSAKAKVEYGGCS
jgi:RHS repeat-associated protein